MNLLPRRRPAPPADDATFVASTRALADLIAPAAILLHPASMQLDSQYVRSLYVVGLPRRVGPGWLSPLIDFDEPTVELSMHLEPLDSAAMVGRLDRRLVGLESWRRADEETGRLDDAARATGVADIERLRDAVERGEEKVFAVGLYLLLRAASPAALDALSGRVQDTLGQMLAHARVAVLRQADGFQTVLPQARQLLRSTFPLETSSAATLFPFTSSTLSMERGMLYGVARGSRSPVLLDPFDPSLTNANMFLAGTSGAGKSFTTKLLARRALLADRHVWIIDPEGEYAPLCRAMRGTAVRLGAGTGHHVNPLDLRARGGPDDPDPLARHIADLRGLLAVLCTPRGQDLSPEEAAAADAALLAAYAGRDITADPETHRNPAPLLADVQRELAGQGKVGASLAARLAPSVSGSLRGVFSAATNVDLENPLVVFDLHALAAELRPLAVTMLAMFIWQQVQAAPRPRLLFVDEAWALLQYPAGAAFLDTLARRARKHWLGLVAITQQVRDALATPEGAAILELAATKFLLRQDETTIGPVTQALRLSPHEQYFLLGAEQGEGLLFARRSRVQLKVEASPAEHEVATSAPAERAVLDAQGAGTAGGWSPAPGDAAPSRNGHRAHGRPALAPSDGR